MCPKSLLEKTGQAKVTYMTVIVRAMRSTRGSRDETHFDIRSPIGPITIVGTTASMPNERTTSAQCLPKRPLSQAANVLSANLPSSDRVPGFLQLHDRSAAHVEDKRLMIVGNL